LSSQSMSREEFFETPETSKEDWNKFVLASSLCILIIIVQIISSIWF